MIDSYVRKLFFHGAAVIWVGLLAGFPFGFVVMHRMDGDVRAWHMAHPRGVLNGLLHLRRGGGARAPLARRATDSALRVVLHRRGMGQRHRLRSSRRSSTSAASSSRLPVSNLAVFTMFVVAVVAVLVGLYLMMRGAREG